MSKPAIWIKRVILTITVLIVLLLTVGFTYEHMSRFIYSLKIKPTGEFANVGNHQLRYLKQGDGRRIMYGHNGDCMADIWMVYSE